ncbi:hypothetical protein POM88_018749 [Heracleum sosnowskyi]|uniref:P-type ATPase A domain-containing protein n=1 Tax=Heracleum sosnowskyi TaxID=360622 RepID=A0AAD8MZJ0_9APIA|nr:hypothetical protein POM88_018749 [Heracleum sosnowskyi]
MPAKTFFSYFKEPLKGSSVNVLGAFISLASGMIIHGSKEGWYEGGSIFVALFLVITVSEISNYNQRRQWDKLSQINNNIQVKLVRNKRHQQISIFDVVVGDIVLLAVCDQVPADGLFVSSHSLQIDESSMTGESDYKDINRKNLYLILGSIVEDGYAKFLVTSIGMNTTWGKAMNIYNKDNYPSHQTHLIARLNKLSYYIGQISLAVSFIVHVILVLWFSTENTKDGDGNAKVNGRKRNVEKMINGILEIVVAAISILFVAIPEGLTLAVTLVLSYSMKRMMADRAIVTRFWLGKNVIEERNFASSVLKLLHQGAGLNTTSSVYMPNSGSELEFSGSPTEKVILSWVVKELQMDVENLKKKSSLIRVKAFSSAKKRSGILLMKNKEDNTMHVHWKGAVETIVAMCSNYYDSLGNMYALNNYERKIFNQIVQGMAASSLRCIAFAHKQVSEDECDDKNQKLVEDNLVMLGLVGIKDPCRPEVRYAVQNCQLAGINIKMITGDSVYTAKAIATECGILRLNEAMDSAGMYSEAMVEGVEFQNYTIEERTEKIEKISVIKYCYIG